MKKKKPVKKKPPSRPRGQASRSTPASSSSRTLRAGQRPGSKGASLRPGPVRPAGELQYKVVELSTVDEGTLERTLNEWTAKGWNLDGVQFAMRESSKRPAMAFVFFTREGAPAEHDTEAARQRLQQMSEVGSPTAQLLGAPDSTARTATHGRTVSAYERLAQLAGMDEPESPLQGRTLEPGE